MVVNSASPTSARVGAAYVAGRSIVNVVYVQCEDSAISQQNETIDYADYQQEVEGPIAAYLAAHSGINYIVLTKGIPIRVAGTPVGESQGGTSRASLDGTLAALGYASLPGAKLVQFNDGNLAQGSAWLNRYWNAHVPFNHEVFGGYLVTRLDGYTEADADALATRALAAERSGSKQGTILLDADESDGLADPTSQPYTIATSTIMREASFNTWNGDMSRAASLLTARSLPVQYEFTTSFVGNESGLGGYFSWGSNDQHFSQAAYNSLTFAPGAIGDTAVSTSGRSFFPQTGGQSMIADLVVQGITGAKGYTDEPLLQSIASPTIALDRYTHGFPLADSFYAASHFVGWVDIVLGDPLAAPYPKSADAGTRADGAYGGNAYPASGLLQAVNYDLGGQGIGRYSIGRHGTANGYRADGVDIEPTSDVGGGYDLGWMAAGQWFRYTVSAPTTGPYSVTVRVASPRGVADGFTITSATTSATSGPVAIPKTGGNQVWTSVTTAIGLQQDQQTLKLTEDSAGWSMHDASFVLGAPFLGTPAALPGTVQAENYDDGGRYAGYNFGGTSGTANGYRLAGDDLEVTEDVGGGYDLGWTAPGQWTTYTVDVPTAGQYEVSFRVATPDGVPDAFHLSDVTGNPLSPPVGLPATGGNQLWETVTAVATLPAGRQVIYLQQDNGGWNMNYFSFTPSQTASSPR